MEEVIMVDLSSLISERFEKGQLIKEGLVI